MLTVLKTIQHWYQAELNPCAAYIGKKRAWPLYDIAEKERIQRLYPLRFACPTVNDTEALLTKTKLKKAGFSEDQIAWVYLHPKFGEWESTLKWVKVEADAA